MKLEGIAVFLFSLGWASATDYCKICQENTFCKYQNKGLGKACKEPGAGGVTEADKQLIVNTHNSLRRRIAKGQETRGKGGPQPKASNMEKMTWDNELAKMAQTWADQCLFQHDKCREVPRFKVGQNIYWSWRSPPVKEGNWTSAIISWYNEVDLFNPNIVKRYKFESDTGHYTQLIWHNTKYVGCGRRDYGPSKIYVCNYGPAGNWLNDPIYGTGKSCSKCPSGTRCNDGLCEETPGRKALEIIEQPEDSLQKNYGSVPQTFGNPGSFQQGFQNANSIFTQGKAPKDLSTEGSSASTTEEFDVSEKPQTLNLDQKSETYKDNASFPFTFALLDDIDPILLEEDLREELEELRTRTIALIRKITDRNKDKFYYYV